MKEIVTTPPEPPDAQRFRRSVEDANFVMRFVGLTPEQVVAALDRMDSDLADAFEKAGMRVRSLRYQYRRRGPVPKVEGQRAPPNPFPFSVYNTVSGEPAP